MKRVVVTGAAGFLGSHLAKHHLDAGDQVMGIDDFSSSSASSEHLKDLRAHENFTFELCNITKSTADDAVGGWAWRQKGIDVIYNFACPASPPRYQDMPVHTMMTCVVGTERMLRLAERYSTDRRNCVLVHASTSEVYGDPEHSPQKESYRGCVNSYGPRACYDEGKRAAEALCYDYLNKLNIDARMVRIFNTYGPNMDPDDGRVVTNFIKQALKGERLTIYGGGTQTRSFCYVDDLVRGIVALGALRENPGTPINVGNPNEFTILELATKVGEKVMGDAFDPADCLAGKPLPADDPLQRRPDITLAKRFLGWEPQVQLSEGLDRTIAYLRTVVK